MSNKIRALAAAVAVAATFAAITPAHAISEAYRRQLQREHKTQQDEIREVDAEIKAAKTKHFTGGDNNMFDVVTDSHCRIKTINGFAPKRIEQKHGKALVTAATGDKFEVNTKACHVGWKNDGVVIPLEQE